MRLRGLGVDDSEGLEVLQVGVLRHLVWKGCVLVGANLRHNYECSDLFDERVVGRAHAVHVGRDLDAQVAHANEFLEHILR